MTIRDDIRERGPQVLGALEGLAREYGDDLLLWAFARIRERRSKRAGLVIDRAAAMRKALLRDGEQGDGHQ